MVAYIADTKVIPNDDATAKSAHCGEPCPSPPPGCQLLGGQFGQFDGEDKKQHEGIDHQQVRIHGIIQNRDKIQRQRQQKNRHESEKQPQGFPVELFGGGQIEQRPAEQQRHAELGQLEKPGRIGPADKRENELSVGSGDRGEHGGQVKLPHGIHSPVRGKGLLMVPQQQICNKYIGQQTGNQNGGVSNTPA